MGLVRFLERLLYTDFPFRRVAGTMGKFMLQGASFVLVWSVVVAACRKW